MTGRKPTLVNANKAITFVDRAYVYDNSIDNQLPRLLFRTTDGQLFKVGEDADIVAQILAGIC